MRPVTVGRNPDVAIIAPLKQWGGLERKFLTLCREFVERGVRPEIICLRGGDVPYPDLLPSEVTVRKLATQSKRDGVPAVARYLREVRPRRVVTAKDHAAQVTLLARSLGRVEVPVFIKITNMPSEVIRRPFQRWSARRLYPSADGVIAISEGVASDVVRNFCVDPARVALIYNPALTRDFPQRLGLPAEHPWFSDRPGPPTIIAAGRLTRQKDFTTLIDAFATLRKRRPCRLMILGEGAERTALEARARHLGVVEDCVLPGQVPDPVPYMAAADLFVMSSRYEGLGNVLIEALAAGTRLVSTDCPSGPREILCGGRYGSLVPVGHVERLADAMEQALAEPRPTPEAVRVASQRFDAGAVAGMYLRTIGLDHA